MVKFLEPESYDHLCLQCRGMLADITSIMEEGIGPDTDDEEAPINWMYDRRLFCGGHECGGEKESDE